MKLLIEQADIEQAVNEFVNRVFGVEVPTVSLTTTKGKVTAEVDIAPNTAIAKIEPKTVDMGPGKVEVLPGKEVTEKEVFEPVKPVEEEPTADVFNSDDVENQELVEEELPVEDDVTADNLFAT